MSDVLRALSRIKESLHKNPNKPAASLKHTALQKLDSALANNMHKFCFDLMHSAHPSREELFRRLSICTCYLQNAPHRLEHYLKKEFPKGAHLFIATSFPGLVSALSAVKGLHIHCADHLATNRLLAKQLRKQGHSVHYYSSVLLPEAIGACDLVVLGEGEFTRYGMNLPAGGAITALLAKQLKVPTVAVGLSWSYLHHAPRSDFTRFWKGAPKNIKQYHKEHELVDYAFIERIVSDIGIFQPKHLYSEIKNKYPWI